MPEYTFNRIYKKGYIIEEETLLGIVDIIQKTLLKNNYKDKIFFKVYIGEYHCLETDNYDDINKELTNMASPRFLDCFEC